MGRRQSCVLVAVLALAPTFLGGADGALGDDCPPHLFILGRSKNANIVAYDAHHTPMGDLAGPAPVVAYWLLGGEKGKREELNLVERQHAYGFDITPGEVPGTYEMLFKAERKRRLTIRVWSGCPAATMSIGGRDGILRKLFVRSKEGGSLPKVEYVEFFGEDLATGEPLYEKFVPAR